MKVGFTGTREGMTDLQKFSLLQKLRIFAPLEVNHGMCAGADTEFHQIIRDCFPECVIIGHPPERDFMKVDLGCDKYRRPYPYLERDRNIVDASDILIACPLEMTKNPRSGTWFTYSYSLERYRKTTKKTILILRNGEIK